MSIFSRFFRTFKFYSNTKPSPEVVVPTLPPVPPVIVPVPAPPAPVPAPLGPGLNGCNLTGGDTYWGDWTVAKGPVSGTNYLFVSDLDIDYCISKGMGTFRLLFTWEALQPVKGARVGLQPGNYASYWATFLSRVNYITSKGCRCIIDIHGGDDRTFAAYFGSVVRPDNMYGFDDLWAQLAIQFKNNPLVMFGITNEPHYQLANEWFSVAQKVIDAIRFTGSTNYIVMPGTAWTGAGGWTPLNSSSWNLRDPLNRTAVQVHLYFDSNAGGGDESIQYREIGVDRMKSLVSWARSKNLQVIVGEVGLSGLNPDASAAWRLFAEFCKANKDVVGGWLFWAYGPPSWWGTYKFTLCQSRGRDSAQMTLIEKDFAS